MAKKINESDVTQAVIAHANKLRLASIRLALQPGVARGWPDYVFFNDFGDTLFIEFKAPGKKASPVQQYRLRMLKRRHIPAEVIDNEEEGRLLLSVFARGLLAA